MAKKLKVRAVMSKDPAYCTPRTSLEAVAQLMRANNCGAIPVTGEDRMPIGIITDRDIVMRSIAVGKAPSSLTAQACMTAPVTTITEDATLDDCCELLEIHQIRRVVVVDKTGRMVGIVAQADVAHVAKKKAVGTLLRAVSTPVAAPPATTEAPAADPDDTAS
jgi:CBS domain-containing protein